MLRQTVVLPEAVPESTRMPGLIPLSGAATELFWIFARIVPFELRATARIPLPSTALIVLLLIVTVRSGASVTPKTLLTPAATPLAAKVLFGAMTLPLTVAVTVAAPSALTEMAVPVMFAMGL